MRYIVFILIVFALSAYTPTETNKTIVYQGIAKDLDSQALIYREVHSEIHNYDGHIITQTNFFDVNDELIAERMLDFSNSKTKPNYSLNDLRTGLKESVTHKNGMISIRYKENKNTREITKSLEVPEPAIVDGGFNYFVKSQWETLAAGEVAYFNFISTERQTYYRFQLSKSDEYPATNDSEIIIKMEPSNYILSLILDPIYISYNKGSKRIVNYKGISNIKDIKGNNHFATLTYPTVGP